MFLLGRFEAISIKKIRIRIKSFKLHFKVSGIKMLAIPRQEKQPYIQELKNPPKSELPVIRVLSSM